MLFKKDINKKIEHLVKKNDFYAVADYVYGTKEEKLDLSIPASCRNNTIVPKVMKPWYNLNTAQPKQRYDTISPVIDINR